MGPETITPESQPSFEDHCMENLQVVDDELAAYLASLPDLTVSDPIEYWSKRNGDLARMSMDICGCPGQLFSPSEDVCLTLLIQRHPRMLSELSRVAD
jgi:hypothetical protein